MLSVKMPRRIDHLKQLIWVGETLVVIGSVRNNVVGTPAFDVAATFHDESFGFRNGKSVEINSVYDSLSWGFIDEQPVFRQELLRRTNFYFIEESLLSDDRLKDMKKLKAKENGNRYITHHHKMWSRAGNTVACGEGARWRDLFGDMSTITDIFPKEISIAARENLDRNTFLLFNYCDLKPRFMRMEKPITGVSVRGDQLVVAVATRQRIYFVDIDSD